MTIQASHITFGTDGYRGILSKDFTFDTVEKIAQGFADYLVYKNIGMHKKMQIVVGYDTRFLSDKFANSFAEILCSNQINTTLLQEPVPTSALSYLTFNKFDYGIMITASHNKHFYNGIKIKQAGRSAQPSMTAELETYISKAIPLKSQGLKMQKKSFKKAYTEYLLSKVKANLIRSKLPGPVIVDCMYGSNAEIAGEIFNSKNIYLLHTKIDPLFGGIQPEPVEKNLSELIETVKTKKAVAGIAFDGDGDRFTLVNDKGQYVTPCQTAPVLLDYLLAKNKFKGKVVQTVSMGYLTKRIAKAKGVPFEEVPVGFKYIAEKMISDDVSFGVEESGGYSWKGNIPERDGLLTGLLVLEILSTTKRRISEIYNDLEKKYGKSFFTRIDLKLDKPITNKHSFAIKLKKKLPKVLMGRKISETITFDGLKVILDNDDWLLIRPSGTEPLIRTYAETGSQTNTKKLLEFAAEIIK
jgi:phosphomannomutase